MKTLLSFVLIISLCLAIGQAKGQVFKDSSNFFTAYDVLITGDITADSAIISGPWSWVKDYKESLKDSSVIYVRYVLGSQYICSESFRSAVQLWEFLLNNSPKITVKEIKVEYEKPSLEGFEKWLENKLTRMYQTGSSLYRRGDGAWVPYPFE